MSAGSDVDRHPMLTNVTVTSTEVRKAQRSAARNAGDLDELETFLSMLGVHPTKDSALIVRD